MPADVHPTAWLRRAALVSSLICALAAAATAQASEVTRFEVDFFAPGKTKPVNRATVWVGKGVVRIEQQASSDSAPGPTLIYRGDRGLVFSISERTKSYVEIDRGTITRMDEQARRLRHELARQLDALPPGQRAQLERMLGMSGADPRQNTEPMLVVPAEGHDEVAGFRCRNVTLERSEELIGEGCVTDWARIGLSEKDLEVFRTLANLQRDAMAARGFTPLELIPDQPFDLLTQLGGMPLFFERKAPRSGQISAIRVQSITPERSLAGRFDPPSGYARHTGGAAMLEQIAGSGTSPSAPSPAEETGPAPASPAAPR